MLFANIHSEFKKSKVEALCPALSHFTFLRRLKGRTWFRKKKSKCRVDQSQRWARHPEAVVGRELGGSSLLDPNVSSNQISEEEVIHCWLCAMVIS